MPIPGSSERLTSSENEEFGACAPSSRSWSKGTQGTWKPIWQPDWTVLPENSKSVRMNSPKPNRCRLALPLNLSKFNASATNYVRNSFDALKRPIRCTGTLDTPERMSS